MLSYLLFRSRDTEREEFFLSHPLITGIISSKNKLFHIEILTFSYSPFFLFSPSVLRSPPPLSQNVQIFVEESNRLQNMYDIDIIYPYLLGL